MLTFPVDPSLLVGFLLLSARLLAMMQFAPPFNGGGVPLRMRLALSVAVAAAVTPVVYQQTGPVIEPTVPALIGAIIYQIGAGVAMGVVIQLFIVAIQAAGSMIDVISGIGIAVLYDPITQVEAAPVGRLHQLIALTGLFIVDGHLLMMRGLIRSFEVAPVSGLQIEAIPEVAAKAAGDLLIAGIEIALPVLVALSMTEAVLALASRAAPRLNVMVLGFAAKSMVMILVLTVSLPLAVRSVSVLAERSVVWSLQLLGG